MRRIYWLPLDANEIARGEELAIPLERRSRLLGSKRLALGPILQTAEGNRAVDRLLEGHARFQKGYWAQHRALFAELARKGQSPSTMVVACCESRVPVEVVFDCPPGEIFVLRSIANLVPPYAPDAAVHGTSAALEYAMRELKVPRLVILGHTLCGGIRALVRGLSYGKTDFVGLWMSVAEEARQRSLAAVRDPNDIDAICRVCEHESIRASLANLKTFPWIKSRLADDDLQVGGFVFDVESGELNEVEVAAGEA